MKIERFSLALERLQPEQWAVFEGFASAFLSTEHSDLRTVASSSGDRGRDAELFSPEAEPTVVFQYSVTRNWRDKIRKTAKRLSNTLEHVTILVYVTNQLIGAEADKLKNQIRTNFGLYLDIRDRTWFLERCHADPSREAIAEDLAAKIVDPYLASKGVIENRGSALSKIEAKAAFVYLGLQWEDDHRKKGLTKICFEALVRSVLRDTNSSNRMRRADILDTVRDILPGHSGERVDLLTNNALKRLTKKHIRHWIKVDEFCLTFEEQERIKGRLTSLAHQGESFAREILESLAQKVPRVETLGDDQISDIADRIKSVLERFLFSRGEYFAEAVRSGNFQNLGLDELKGLVIDDINRRNWIVPEIGPLGIDLTLSSIREILLAPTAASEKYLRGLADSYTLMAFLRETPDVQAAVSKMFSYGDIWLDTTILLPLLAEELLEEGSRRRFFKMIKAGIEAGLKLKVTPGVVEEIERHMNRSLVCVNIGNEWEGSIPFLLAIFIETGQSRMSFGIWLERFRGSARPQEDISDYLSSEYGITTESLEKEMHAAPHELRLAVQEAWHEQREKKRSAGLNDLDDITLHRLVLHDVENFVGVIQRREREVKSPLGYTSWWLTADRTAFRMQRLLRGRLTYRPPPTPILSADFLINYLALGPVRRQVSKSTESTLPLVVDAGLVEYLTPELIAQAEMIRQNAGQLPEHVIRRRVRDKLDEIKSQPGEFSFRAMDIVRDEVSSAREGRRTP